MKKKKPETSSASSNETNLPLYSQRKSLIDVIFNTISYLLILFASVSIFFNVRATSLSSAYYLNDEHIVAHSLSFAYSINEQLIRYEISAKFIGLLSLSSNIVMCDVDHMFFFKKICDSINSFTPRPYRYYLSHDNIGSCQLEYNYENMTFFDLYYYFPYNETHDQIKHYNENTDFKSWDPDSEGTFISFVTREESDFRYNNREERQTQYWTPGIAQFGGQTDTRVFTNIYPAWENNQKLVSLAGTSVYMVELYDMLMTRTQAPYSHFVITDSNYNVLIENEIGAVWPLYVNVTLPIFPSLRELNKTIWNEVADYINLTELEIDQTQISNISFLDEAGNNDIKQYMIIKRVLQTRSEQEFYLIMLFELNPVITKVYYDISLLFLFLAFGAVIVISIYKVISLKIEQNQTSKLLKKSTEGKNIQLFNLKIFDGTLSKAIERLRRVELSYPEDSMLNKTLDTAINELARNKDEIFNVEYKNSSSKSNSQHGHCEFCSYLNPNENFQSVSHRKNSHKKISSNGILSYGLWDTLIKAQVDKQNYLNDRLYESNPRSFLIRMFTKLIFEEKLYFNDLDPDLVITFVIIYISSNQSQIENFQHFIYNKIESLRMIIDLLKGPFNNWIPSKLHFFAVAFAKVVQRNFPHSTNIINTPTIDSYFYNDGDYILTNFHKYLTIENREFDFIVKTLLNETTNEQKLATFGEFYNRVQSPSFFLNENIKDEILFLKVLFNICDFSAYFIGMDGNKCFTEINNSLFSPSELKDSNFIYKFHLEFAEKILKEWLKLLCILSNMNVYEDYLNSTIDFFKEKIIDHTEASV